jgi:hypothetical protein
MLKKNFRIKGKVWRWPGIGGWHFVTLGRELTAKIREEYGKGMIKIIASAGKSFWDTSLFPHTRDRTYLICIKKIIRQKEGIYEGDIVSLKFRIL